MVKWAANCRFGRPILMGQSFPRNNARLIRYFDKTKFWIFSNVIISVIIGITKKYQEATVIHKYIMHLTI